SASSHQARSQDIVMRTPYLTPFVAGLLLLFSGGMKAIANEPLAQLQLMTAAELKANAGGHFITTASINGADIKVLVDTGATMVALSYEDASDAGLRPSDLDYNVPITTANGVAQAARVSISRIEVEGIRVDDVDGIVLPEGALHGTLLGMTFLSRLKTFK